MPNTGSGTMTPLPVPGPGGPGTGAYFPIPYTLLSLHRYAQIIGINPMHFAGGATPDLANQIMPVGNCSSVWSKYDWQNNDQVSHMQLAIEIKEAEQEIADAMLVWPAPTWLNEESHLYPRPFAKEYSGLGLDISGRMKTVNARYGQVIDGGRRNVTLIGTATTGGGALAYTDEDGDGYYEIATITLATSLTDVREIKVYHRGYNGDMDWEVRPVRRKSITGGVLTIVLDSWLLIDPAMYERYPDELGYSAINISDTSNFVAEIDVYREFNDKSLASSQYVWENDIISCTSCGGVGCEDCDPETQNGCLTVRNKNTGEVTPFPADYSGGAWTMAEWNVGREPDYVKLWYYSGMIGTEYLQGRSYDPLPHNMAMAIAYLTTARLKRPLCGCGNVQAFVAELMIDVSKGGGGGPSYFMTKDALDSPFGTRKGEVIAWTLIHKLVKGKKLGVAVI